MNYLGAGLILVWIVGVLWIEALYLNDMRRVYNSFIAGALQTAPSDRLGSDLAWRFWFSRIDPALLTEAGRVYRASAIRHERLRWAWWVGGFVVIAGYLSFLHLL